MEGIGQQPLGETDVAHQSLMTQAAQDAERTPNALGLAGAGYLGERIARMAMRRRWARHLREEYAGGPEVVWERFQILLDGLRQSAIDGERGHTRPPIELPRELFELTLGPHMHHASGYFGIGIDDLSDAEAAMLELCAERAQLEDGQKILELGCGWGAMTLWMARNLPHAQITALCRSPTQKRHLEARCQALGVGNVHIIEGALDKLTLSDAGFDRVLSIEMFEHLRNFEVMLARIAGWLRPNGTLFVHMACHRELMYTMEGPELVRWLGKGFCSGRLMASASTLHYFQRHLTLERH